jgi:nicotinamide mononucleotide transporter
MTELAHLLAPLHAVLFVFGNDQVSVAELLGFLTGAASVWLTVLARISNFPVGIANSAFFLALCFAGAAAWRRALPVPNAVAMSPAPAPAEGAR